MQGGRSRQRRHREGHGAEGDRRRHQPEGDVGRPEKALRHRHDDKNCDEKTDAAIGDDRPGQNHRQHGATCAKLLGHEASDDFDRAAVLHELAEQGAKEKQREELRQELRGAAHEGLGPVGEERLACEAAAAISAAAGANSRMLQPR